MACNLVPVLLRRAIDVFVRMPASRSQATADSTAALVNLAGEIVRDAAKGRSLLDSKALAAAEVARQLQLPLSTMAVALAEVTGGGMINSVPNTVASGTAYRADSWYTQARMRLSELTQLLVIAENAVRTRVASEGTASAASGIEAAQWAIDAAGVYLSQPTPLTSACIHQELECLIH